MLKLAKTSLLAVAVMATSVVASDILVTVNGKNITKQDAQAFVTASAPKAIFAQLDPAEQKMVTDRLVEKSFLLNLQQKKASIKNLNLKEIWKK